MKKLLAVLVVALGAGGAGYGATELMDQVSVMRNEVAGLTRKVNEMKKDMDSLRTQLASYQERYKKMYE